MTANIIKQKNGNPNMPLPSLRWVDKVLQDNLDHFFDEDLWGFSGLAHKTTIPVNIHETGKTFELELVAPGLKKENFKLNVVDDVLTVSFEQQEKQEAINWIRQDYKMQSFSRNFNLDDTIDANKISAKYTDGVLYLTLPKKETTQKVSRTIEIG